jgi:hypothetical protein
MYVCIFISMYMYVGGVLYLGSVISPHTTAHTAVRWSAYLLLILQLSSTFKPSYSFLYFYFTSLFLFVIISVFIFILKFNFLFVLSFEFFSFLHRFYFSFQFLSFLSFSFRSTFSILNFHLFWMKLF